MLTASVIAKSDSVHITLGSNAYEHNFLGLELLKKEIRNGHYGIASLIIKDLKASATLALLTLNDMLVFDKILQNILEVVVEKERPLAVIREAMCLILLQVI